MLIGVLFIIGNINAQGGHYKGGKGRSHKGGHYKNASPMTIIEKEGSAY